MQWRALLAAAGLLALGPILSCHPGGPERRLPNIVFVFADQLRSQALGCYGNSQTRTPNLDRPAAEGVRFSNAISTWPLCSPYRAMLLTGRYPMANGVVGNGGHLRDDVVTIAEVCRDQGYATGYIGKWHLGGTFPFVPKNRRRGFDYWAVRNCAHEYFDSFYFADTPEPIELVGYEPIAQTDLVVDFIAEHRDEPFCLFVSWGPPHDPYHAPEEYLERYSLQRLRLRENVEDRRPGRELLRTDSSPVTPEAEELREERESLLRKKSLRVDLWHYYAQTTVLDDCMGRIVEALDEHGLREETILAFSSDHGDMLGSHGALLKQLPYEESISVPFILRYPPGIPAGASTDALLAPVDILPTLLGLAGLPCPEGVDGLDLQEAARGGRDDQRDALLLMNMTTGGVQWMLNGVTPWRGVRTKRYTYARLLDRGPWMLYDNQEDPYQLENLIDDPAHGSTRERLEARMLELIDEADDPVDAAAVHEYEETLRQERREKERRRAQR